MCGSIPPLSHAITTRFLNQRLDIFTFKLIFILLNYFLFFLGFLFFSLCLSPFLLHPSFLHIIFIIFFRIICTFLPLKTYHIFSFLPSFFPVHRFLHLFILVSPSLPHILLYNHSSSFFTFKRLYTCSY